jgi:hypothetical protein
VEGGPVSGKAGEISCLATLTFPENSNRRKLNFEQRSRFA